MHNSEKSERILVVNDEEVICSYISSILTKAGYQCVTAADGVEALILLDSGETFDLLLCNLVMPNLDGMGLLEHTRKRFPDMTVVIQSAVQDVALVLAAFRNGAYDYLQTPFESEALLSLVRRALEHRRLALENRGYQATLQSVVETRTEKLRKVTVDLERSYDMTLEGLGDALALKDAQTERHCKRVTGLARAMGLGADRIAVIARGAFLHDIGKIAIAEKMLLKPGMLTPDEMATMRRHCSLGYEVVKKIPFSVEAAEIVYCHHEHYDGSGYPRGLKVDEIPLGVRIVAVANTLDAITSDRPYRPAQSLPAARDEIRRWPGRQFDPKVVKLFLDMEPNIWTDLRKGVDAQR